MSRLRLSLAIVLSVLAVPCLCSGDDLLRLRASAPAASARVCYYHTFSTASRTVQPGDFVEYDVYTNCRAPGVGGIDVRNADGTYWRDGADWRDQNGLSGKPNADLSRYAFGKWYHRRLAVPASAVGTTVSRWDLAVDGYYDAYAVLSAQYDNVVVTNGGSVVLTVYQSGPPDHPMPDISLGAAAGTLLHGPIRKPDTQVAAFFFYWTDAPTQNAMPEDMPYHPYGLLNDPWAGYGGGYYSVFNPYWWEAEFQDMRRAGVDIAAMVSFGDKWKPYHQIAFMSTYVVPALERSGSGLKIALFDDTSGEVREWNVDQGRTFYWWEDMPLANQSNWAYFYDRKIKPFFQSIPQKYWATHNGLPPEQGGRPIIITWSSAHYAGISTYGAPLYQWVKQRFAEDFADANGQGITPWLVHEDSWFRNGAGAAADAHYAWGAAGNWGTSYLVGDYRTTAIGPGYNDTLHRSPGKIIERPEDGRLVASFDGQQAYSSDLVLVETWNEMWEGTTVGRCKDYPSSGGGYLPETFYMDAVRGLVASSIGFREWDAAFLRTWEIPGDVRPSSVVGITVRNDGFMPWTYSTVSLAGRLVDPATGAVVPGTERVLAPVPSTVISGAECTIGFSVPTQWSTGADCVLQLGMTHGGTWFPQPPLSKPMSFSPSDTAAPSAVNGLTAVSGEKRVTLGWSNPTTPDVKSTVIRMSMTWYPEAVTDGTLVALRPASPGSSDSWTLYPAAPGPIRYFSVFAQDAAGNASGPSMVSCASLPDTTSPAAVSSFAATALSPKSVLLKWTSPSDQDLDYVAVRFSTTGYPGSPTDGQGVCRVYPQPGAGGAFVHENARQAIPAYYSAFACDTDGHFSVAAHAYVVLPVATCGVSKTLPDGSETTLEGEVVTAIFADERCFYVAEPDGTSAIRVTPVAGGIGVGDRVNVVGTLSTVRPDGVTPVERQIISTNVTRTGSGLPPVPVAMTCRAIGGGPVPPYVLGVNDGVGVNTSGMLVRIAGTVTWTYGDYLCVDDGSDVQDMDGRIGVLVRCPGPHGLVVGSFACITGVVEGSRPLGWSTSRRYVRARSWTDVQSL